jgi:RHS repeat-associated protein
MKAVIRFFSIIPMLTIFGMALPTHAQGEEINVFGPQIFSKIKRKPKIETVQFNSPIAVEGMLIIDNGGEENAPKKKRVSNGKIFANGKKIIPHKIPRKHHHHKIKHRHHYWYKHWYKHRHKKVKLNRRTAQIVLPITLKAGNNTFSVKLKGRRGSKISARIVLEDLPPIAVFAATPIQGPSPLNISFDATNSSDPDDSIATYEWDFGEPGAPAGIGITPSHVYTTPGTFIVTLTVTDQFGLTDQTTTTITVTNPNLPPVAAFTATPEEGAAPLDVGFDATGSTDPDDGIASYNWSFGDGATATGLAPVHTYSTPGNFTVTLTVTDTFGLTDQTSSSITVIDLPIGTASLSGRLLDTTDFTSSGIETPVVGATISLIGTTFLTTTDTNGEFQFLGVPPESHILDINTSTANPAPDGSGYAGFRENIEVPAGINKVLRPFFMPRIDTSSLTTVIPDEETIVENPNLNIMLVVQSFSAKNEDGSDFTGQLSISEVPQALAPAALPEALEPGLLITIQPVGVTFDPPAEITFPNTDNLPPDSEVDIWSLDPDAGTFTIVGIGLVSSDGSVIETDDGGIVAADWHAVLPVAPRAVVSAGTDESNTDQSKQVDCACGSENGLKSGELKEDHTLAGYRSFGQQRALTFSYRSLSADPQPVVISSTLIPERSIVPLSLSASLEINGQPKGQEIFTTTTGLDVSESVRQILQFDATDLNTGIYPYRMKVSNNYLLSTISTFQNGNVLVNNQISSPFGAGWTLDGIQRLHSENEDRSILTEGDGSVKLFDSAGVKFSVPRTVPDLGSRPESTDFNGDSLPDLVSLDPSDNRILNILLNDGTGNFVLGFSTPVNTTRGLEVEDLNADGNDDIILAYSSDSSIAVLLGDGAGGFSTPTSFPAGGFPEDIEVGLFNADSFPDLVVTNRGDNTVSVLFGDGAGSFSGLTALDVGRRPLRLEVKDFNSDGNDDIAAMNLATSDISILLGDGLGGFAPETRVAAGGVAPQYITSEDINGDGNFELLIVDTEVGEVFVLLGNGDGSFSQPITTNLDGGGFIEQIHLTDFNADGELDFAVPIPEQESIFIYLGDGTGKFSKSSSFPSGPFNRAFIIGDDFNNDGVIDLVSEQKVYFREDRNNPLGDFSILKRNMDGSYTRTLKDGIKIEFDATGLHTQTVDRNGNTTQFVYDINERLTTITDPAGLATTFAYANGKLTTVTDPSGRVSQFAHDGDGNLTTITDADGSSRGFTYDARHLLVSQTRKNGSQVTYDYNFANRNIRGNAPDGSTREFGPSDVLGLADLSQGIGTEINPVPFVRPEVVATATDGNGNTVIIAMDKFGAPVSTTDALGRVTLTKRDGNSNLSQATQPNGAITNNTYDGKGNLLTTTAQSISATTAFTYEPQFSLITSLTDPLGNATNLVYDVAGNLTGITDAVGTQSVLEYSDANCPGLSTRVINASGSPEETSSTRQYNAATCNLISTTDSLGNTTLMEYDTAGNVTKRTDALGRETRFEYDNLNRAVKSIDASNSDPNPTCSTAGVTCFSYDVAGNLTMVIDARGKITAFTYDTEDRAITRTDGLGNSESFSYDGNGNVISKTNRNGETVLLELDAADQLVKKTLNPGLGNEAITTFTYDLLGNVVFANDSDSALGFVYDLVGRLVTASTFGSPSQPDSSLTYTYNKNGNLLSMNDGTGPAGNPPPDPDPGPAPQGFLWPLEPQWRTAGWNGIQPQWTLAQTVPTQSQLYVYDTLNRLTSLTNPEGQNISFAYDVLSRRTGLTFPNGTSTQSVFDTNNRLTSLTHQKSGSPLSNFGYTYNAINQRTALSTVRSGIPVAATSLNYSYDVLNRLTQATRPLTGQVDETFGYDPVGNRLNRDGQTGNSTFDNGNAIVEDALFTYVHDANGNITSKTNKSTNEVTEYSWDAENRLTTIVERPGIGQPATKTIAYGYDALDRRIFKNVDGTVTSYIYDGEDILHEYDGTNVLQARYTHGAGTDEPLIMDRAGTIHYYHADGLGSITELTDNNGDVAQSYLYDSYGNLLTPITIENPFTFIGREFDKESGLFFYRARYYDSGSGRFLNEDPIGFVGGDINLYRYVGNDPVNFIDPDGLVKQKGKQNIKGDDPIIREALKKPKKEAIKDIQKAIDSGDLSKERKKVVKGFLKNLKRNVSRAVKFGTGVGVVLGELMNPEEAGAGSDITPSSNNSTGQCKAP